MIPAGHTAVMASRREPPGSLDFFPTPPWATRAFMRHVLPSISGLPTITSAADPAAGEGHMAEVLREFVPDVRASDVWDYGVGYPVVDFLDARIPFAPVDLLITNPPYNAGLAFVMRALTVAPIVAVLVRTGWAHTDGRYFDLFEKRPPTLVAFSVERIPMYRGRWVPDGGTATDYTWFVWVRDRDPLPPFWIPPGCRKVLTRPDDARRFALAAETPLFADQA